MKTWSVYILRCGDGTFYTGITNDIGKRIESHSSGHASKYTKSRLPIELIYREQLQNRSEATKREPSNRREKQRHLTMSRRKTALVVDSKNSTKIIPDTAEGG